MLQAARELRGWTREDAASATRIPLRFIEALEEERFDEVGADIFVRGYVRNYARELGANEHAIVASFETRRVATLEHESEISVAEERVKKYRDVKLTHLIGALFALIGLIAFVGLVSGSDATAENPTEFQESTIDPDVEADVKKTRWLLEQPPSERNRLKR